MKRSGEPVIHPSTQVANMEVSWESEIGQLLSDLSAVQQELLDVLNEKRRCLAAYDIPGMMALLPREETLGGQLAECQRRRLELLDRASGAGLPSSNLRALTKALPTANRDSLAASTEETAMRARMLAHQGLANWVVVQRTLLHLAQLFEIIATGGRQRPTYGEEHSSQASGSFVDQAA
jgi:hypothetical protein